MPRPPRPQIENATYHVTSRGNRRADIYLDASDRRYFFNVLTRVVEKYSWSIHAYCLMTNHYHLVVKTFEPTISRGMQRLNSMYAQWFNWRYRDSGHVFQGRFYSDLVETDAHFLEACRYIVLNPVRAGICDDPSAYGWSSYRATAGKEIAPEFLTTATIGELLGGKPELVPTLFAAFVSARVEEAIRGRNGHVSGLTPALSV
jgi:REP element-mobilizing transposase RayT